MSKTRQTLRDFFNSELIPTPKGEGNSKLSYNVKPLNPGDPISRDNQDDLGSFTDETGVQRELIDENAGFLGNYVRYIVKESKNLYYPSSNNQIVELENRGTKVTTELQTTDGNKFMKATITEADGGEQGFSSAEQGKNYLNNIEIVQII